MSSLAAGKKSKVTQLSRRAAVMLMIGSAGAAASGCAVNSSPVANHLADAAATPVAAAGTLARAPLTGNAVADAATLNHAAVAVKVSDVRSAHPQAGLNQADIVFVEPNGISYIRLCAVFHSQFPKAVGPVRSIRPVDVPLLSPMKPVFGNTAAAGWVMNYVAAYSEYLENLYSFKAGVHGKGAYETFPHRAPVHSVFCHPDALRKLAKKMKSAPTQPYLPFATGTEQVSTSASGKPAAKVSVPWGPGDHWNTSYDYDEASKQYLRNEPWGKHVLTDGKRVATDNVLVVRAKWKMDKIYGGSGAVDPVVDIIKGKGTFYYLNQGKYVQGTWTKGAVNAPFKFTLDDGSPLKVAPGRTFFELPQINAKVKITG
jgi:hypothetical protein